MDEIDEIFADIRADDKEFAEFERTWEVVASFLTDYEHLKGMCGSTQRDIAKSSKTSQSAISRLERMKGKPTVDLLRRLSESVGGKLFLTPLSDVTVTLPYDLHDKAREQATLNGLDVPSFLSQILRNEIDKTERYEQSNDMDFMNC